MVHGLTTFSVRLFVFILLSALLLTGPATVVAQGGVEQLWSFKTGGGIFAAAIVDQGVVYVGSMDSCLYALSSSTGTQIWKFNAHRPIQSRPVIAGSIICFEGTNQFWGLDKSTGNVVWHYAPTTDMSTSFDSWDYHHSSPVLVGSTIYVGGANGKVYGFNPADGAVVYQYSTGRNSPIRTDITFEDSTLYFGDFGGTFDAVNMRTGNLRWSEVSTNTSTPTLSPMTSDGRIFENMLLFGGRSTKVMAKDKATGMTYWTYIDPDGSWMIADPVISDGVLYMGGSGNHSFFAFDCRTGTIRWRRQLPKYMLAGPVVGPDYIVTSMEDAGNVGPGAIVVLDKANGTIRQLYIPQGNTVASPCVSNDVLYFGTSAGDFYAVRGLTTIVGQFPQIQLDTRTLSFPNTSVSMAQRDTSFYIYNRGSGADSLKIVLNGDASYLSAFSVSPSVCTIGGHDSVRVSISVAPSHLTAGRTYMPYLSITTTYNIEQTSFQRSVKIKVIAATGIKESPVGPHEFRLNQNYPNPFNPSTDISYSIPEAAKVDLSVNDISGREVARLVHEYQQEGEHRVRFTAEHLASGIYVVRLAAGDLVSARKICFLK